MSARASVPCALSTTSRACYDSTRPYTLNFDAGFEQLVLHMPRAAMVRRIGRTEVWTARRIAGTSPVGSLVLPFVQRAASIVSDVVPATASQLSETCLLLVTAALGERLGEIAAGGSSARTALIFRAKAMIDSNLYAHALNTEKVAQLVGISPRYLQDLFHAEGTTVSDWIWQRRLDKSRRDLADPLRAGDRIVVRSTFRDVSCTRHRLGAASILAHVQGDDKKAIELARAAADLDATMDKHPATPAVGVVAQRLLVLLQGRAGLVEFEQQVGEQLARREDRGGGGRIGVRSSPSGGRTDSIPARPSNGASGHSAEPGELKITGPEE